MYKVYHFCSYELGNNGFYVFISIIFVESINNNYNWYSVANAVK